jgi:GTPase SAR1 family protein
MIILIEGLAGAGKTWLMSRLVKKEWKQERNIYPNFPLYYDEENTRIKRWHNLDECFHIKDGVLCIDESQKFLDARRWHTLPLAFTEKIAMHRHHHLDIYSTTQDLGHIDIRLRSNVHELFKCETVLRFPKKQRFKPLLHIIKVVRKERVFQGENQYIKWSKIGFTHYHFISRFWTKTYYNTYGDVGEQKFLCRINYKKSGYTTKPQWTARVASRDLVERGKVRL